MKWFSNLKAGSKLIFGFAMMMFFICAIGINGYGSGNTINRNLEEISAVRLPVTD